MICRKCGTEIAAKALICYRCGTATTEPLFSAMMKDVLELSPQTKHEGLTEFETRGYLLLDATYTPVNIPGNKSARKKAAAAQITKDFPLLVAPRPYSQPRRTCP